MTAKVIGPGRWPRPYMVGLEPPWLVIDEAGRKLHEATDEAEAERVAAALNHPSSTEPQGRK